MKTIKLIEDEGVELKMDHVKENKEPGVIQETKPGTKEEKPCAPNKAKEE